MSSSRCAIPVTRRRCMRSRCWLRSSRREVPRDRTRSLCERKQTIMAQVLLVDDDPALRCLLHAMLQDDGHVILETSDGVEALATVRASSAPLIVLLDW